MIALIGVGNLGHALLNYNFHKSNNARISAAFDIDPKITGLIQSGIPVYPMEDMQEQLQLQQIEIAILTVPANKAQSVTDELVAAGIKGILNFTPLRITVPNDVRVQNVDLTNELQTLIYFYNTLNNYEKGCVVHTSFLLPSTYNNKQVH